MEREFKKRAEDVGWKRLTHGLPIAMGLAAAIITGAVGFTTVALMASANAEDNKATKAELERHRQRLIILETTSAATEASLTAIQRTQEQNIVRSAADKQQILDAIRSNGRSR